MRIGLDVTKISPANLGGVNTFTLGLIGGLLRVAGDRHTFQLYVTDYNAELFSWFADAPTLETIRFPHRNGIARVGRAVVARSAYLGSTRLFEAMANATHARRTRVMDERSDLIYQPTTTLYPFNFRKPTLLSMHDIQHVHYPEFFTPRHNTLRTVHYELSSRHVTYIQASSQFIKRDLLENLPRLRPEQIVVIPEGVDIGEFATPSTIDVVAKYQLAEPFLYLPAQLWHHKNHVTVLKALDYLYRERGMTIPLVLTGKKASGAQQIIDFIAERDMRYVRYLGPVPFADLIALYQRARFFITAVLYESSSLPFLEAGAAGTPVIASRTPPNEEMSQILQANLFDPLDHRELAGLLERIWNDDALVRSQTEHNRQHIGYYSWDNAARRYLDFIEPRITP